MRRRSRRHQSRVLRRGHRRRRGDDDVQPDEVGGRHEPTRCIILRRAVMPHTHGRDVREHRREVVNHPRATGHARGEVARARRRRAEKRPVRLADRPGPHAVARSQDERGDTHPRREGRRNPRGHHPGFPRQASRRFQEGRIHHPWKRVASLRRRRVRGPRAAFVRQRQRAAHHGTVRILRRGRCRPESHGYRPRGRHPRGDC
mmetsp:Transcript_16125/g.43974  ORF Transcript_16125/g.43974 Transcript_16125/m.43974 type:complete len:203 (-) Transcript_16125:427-1035(-)